MRKLLLFVFVAAVMVAIPASAALAQNVALSATDTGINGASLSTTPLSSPIHMEGVGRLSNQLSLTFAVTPGTTTRIRVACYESSSKTLNFAQIGFCDSASPSNCQPDVREFTIADYANVSGVRYIKSRWEITEQWAKCSATDPDAGNGTVVVTGTRSKQ